MSDDLRGVLAGQLADGMVRAQLLAACRVALSALLGRSELERANAIRDLRAAIEVAERH